ncbi:hypothetical protein [Shewanella sp.]|uniref:hypothetical protein n=1 Tax=Shewanella sp. TaxID=50422 RepID=UPI003F3039F1
MPANCFAGEQYHSHGALAELSSPNTFGPLTGFISVRLVSSFSRCINPLSSPL